MQIQVHRNDLFEQLPREIRRQMVGRTDIPEMFTFEVERFEVGQFPDEAKIRAEWPDVYASFTAIEWYMFCCLMTMGSEVPYEVMGAHVKGFTSEAKNPSNNVNVHVKNMRKKLVELGVPLEIHTIRAGGGRSGGCYIERV